MEEILYAFLGPLTGFVLAISFLMVLLLHKLIRKRHIVKLLIITVLSFVGFFAFLLWSFTSYSGSQPIWLYHVPLKIMAALAVGCGSAIGFAFILKSLGIASLEDEDAPARGRVRRGQGR
jgi:hypothetical protein